MMMNLRGLILDDPKYTVHLCTLRSASYHDSDEEPTWNLVWINLKGLSSLQLSILYLIISKLNLSIVSWLLEIL
jgi:hypothetical protein